MLSQRGYLLNIKRSEEYNNERFVYENKEGHFICVFDTIVKKFGIEKVTEYIRILNEMNINHCITIYSIGVTPSASKVLLELTGVTFELFNQKELQFNITKHFLVPTHIKLDKKDAENFKKEYGTKFATIFTSDAIARFYNYKAGDIIQINRNDSSVGYRVVKFLTIKNQNK